MYLTLEWQIIVKIFKGVVISGNFLLGRNNNRFWATEAMGSVFILKITFQPIYFPKNRILRTLQNIKQMTAMISMKLLWTDHGTCAYQLTKQLGKMKPPLSRPGGLGSVSGYPGKSQLASFKEYNQSSVLEVIKEWDTSGMNCSGDGEGKSHSLLLGL